MPKKTESSKKSNTYREVKNPKHTTRVRDEAETPEDETKTTAKKAKNARSGKVVHQIMPYFLMALALFSVVCFILIDGFSYTEGVGLAGGAIRDFLCGMFGIGAFIVPLVLAVVAVGWQNAADDERLLAKGIYAILSQLFASALVQVLWRAAGREAEGSLYELGKSLRGGGLLGGGLGDLLFKLLGPVGTPIFVIPFTLIFFVFLVGLTPGYVAKRIRARMEEARDTHLENAKIRREEKQLQEKESREAKEAKRLEAAEKRELEAQERKARREQLALEAAERKAKLLEIEAANAAAPSPAPVENGYESEEIKLEPVVVTRSESAIPADDYPKASVVVKPSPAEDHVFFAADDAAREESRPLFIDPDPSPEPEVINDPEPLPLPEDPDEYKLEDIFREEPKREKVSVPSEKTEEGTASELDMSLLADMKQISDLPTVPDTVEEDDAEDLPADPVPEPEEEREYLFPPIDLLAEDKNKEEGDTKAELVENAQKLTETLSSFNVRIKEITYSRGPTITRYELKPDVGVRVRSIANLVDDISLSLATTGVRIEAPIPNKPAVGIEVPNRTPKIVYLRSLIDTERFSTDPNKLCVCLGADVAGTPIYFNIGKMPHLLIAGATGMGKSVCINSIIISLLYRARPDEVKLILIDPKKVEFSIYKDIPHLYCPIVSEPTKAAGALASAVTEMERRFELIEAEGVRDIAHYNAAIKGDPTKEFMPQMVIIIDELADLMMTAADAVESSICRLAQKARAAGIYLIIGTQRPSVDVITGLIKANVPSRIAFTVASQVDSRTIIDIAGAEKLIGRGDMLFAPVGSAKPMRVQGALVDETEVEKVVTYIHDNNSGAQYNEEFINHIEEEAAKCSAGKKGVQTPEVDADGDDADKSDPMFYDAVEVAVDSGKISTSLLQRKLSIGYGRAAKIIDSMEECGYISPADGNKPRKILITKEDLMQITMNLDE